MVALANAEGGTVVVGLSDGQIDGVAVGRLNELRQAAHDCTVPVVEPGELVHKTSKGERYLRIGDESRRLTYAQRRELEFDRGHAPYDGTPADADTDDLDAVAVDRTDGCSGRRPWTSCSGRAIFAPAMAASTWRATCCSVCIRRTCSRMPTSAC